jgi:hypothetical protein
MFDTDPADLDADATLTAAAEAQAVADRAEVQLLTVAAHWADLHAVAESPADGRFLPGMERLVGLGGEGTPPVAEFSPAELAAQLGMSPWAGSRLVGAALDLRHRLPRLWAVVQAGHVRPWIARKAAETTRTLSLQVVAQAPPSLHSRTGGRREDSLPAVDYLSSARWPTRRWRRSRRRTLHR